MRGAGLVVALGVVVLLCACGDQSDRNTDGFVVVNEGDSTLSVVVADTSVDLSVEPHDKALIPMDDCLGTGITVSDDAGPVYEYDGRICVAEVLRVAEDGTAGIEDMFG